ncbi:MAG: hypothetical protein CSA81_14430 [Acidobacteria bacterium]|nr:MAG: hypothetical protein CSA81_14430 [Acidobacteriota bacterium]
MKKKYFFIILAIVTLLAGFVLYRLDQMDIKAAKTVDATFSHKENNLSGSLYLPDEEGQYDVVVFVHGDGSADRTLDGGYNFIINRLLGSGYAVFSYDKAGVGGSTGNWLKQSMKDRAEETAQAVEAVKNNTQVKSIGTLAFSQGGWVTSELALMNAPLDFCIVAGGAIDWMDQHVYYETQYAEHQGFSKEQTQKYLDYVRRGDAFVAANDYDGYIEHANNYEYGPPMSKERFDFAYINHKANATEGISSIQVPFLGLFGDADKNVDVQNSIAVYEKVFKANDRSNYDLRLIENANHELLDSKYSENKDSLILDAFLHGDAIFADGALDTVVDWLDKTVPSAGDRANSRT